MNKGGRNDKEISFLTPPPLLELNGLWKFYFSVQKFFFFILAPPLKIARSSEFFFCAASLRKNTWNILFFLVDSEKSVDMKKHARSWSEV